MPLPPIPGKRSWAIAQRGFRRDVGQLFTDAADGIRGDLQRYASPDGTIAKRQETAVVTAAGNRVLHLFVGLDGRSAFASDGVTPLAKFPQLLNKWIVYGTVQAVRAHRDWLKRTLPDDMYAWLRTAKAPAKVREMTVTARFKPGFAANRLATYDSAHSWVDPNGYVLSDRVWQNGVKTRMQLDALLTESIRQGKSATQIADLAERFLHPDRAALRTKKPYGRDGSRMAIQLGRSEIAAASNEAALLAAQLNPFVDGVDVVRSSSGDPKCPICPEHATIDIDGSRVAEPYAPDEVDPPPYHTNDMCRIEPAVSATPDEIISALQDYMDAGEDAPLTPAADNELLLSMLGPYLFGLIMQYLNEGY